MTVSVEFRLFFHQSKRSFSVSVLSFRQMYKSMDKSVQIFTMVSHKIKL